MKMFKILILSAAISSALNIQNVIANTVDNNSSTTQIAEDKKTIDYKLLLPLKAISDPIEKLKFLDSLFSNNKEYNGVEHVTINDNGKLIPITITSFLLLSGMEEEAIYLLDSKKVKPFLLFEYNDNMLSDIIIAIENNYINFFDKSIELLDKEEINKQYKYNGENGFYLLMHTAFKKDNHAYHFTYKLIENGANENLQTYNNMTAIKIAQIEKNRLFLNAISDYRDKLNSNIENDIINNEKPKLKNTKLSNTQTLEQIRILNNFKNGLLDEVFKNKDEYNTLRTMLILGYNDVADLIFNRLKEEDRFNPNEATENGMTLLMATALSEISGGNVEYTLKLIEEGAKIDLKDEIGINAAQMAVSRDNAKVLLVLLQNSANMFEKNIEGMDLYEQAISKKPASINSALILQNYVKMIIDIKNSQ